MNTAFRVASATLLALTGLTAQAQSKDIVVDPKGEVPYVIDQRNVVARSGFDLCWRTGYWTPAAAGAVKAGELPVGFMLMGENSRYILLVMAVTWAGDTGGYFAGRFLGKRKLYEAVSPKKTIAGAIGGLSSSTIVVMHFSRQAKGAGALPAKAEAPLAPTPAPALAPPVSAVSPVSTAPAAASRTPGAPAS